MEISNVLNLAYSLKFYIVRSSICIVPSK